LAGNKQQGEQGEALTTLLQAQRDFETALDLNDRSLAGPLVEQGQFAHRLRDTARGMLGMDRNDPELQNTALLQSILSGQTLTNLKNLMRGNPTEAERNYVERLGAVTQMTAQERKVLLQRGIQLLEPRIAFEKARTEALNRGEMLSEQSYQDWLKKNWQNYGE
jgi:hypothetical protein